MIFFKQQESSNFSDEIRRDYEEQFGCLESQEVLKFADNEEAERFFISQIQKKREFFFSQHPSNAQDSHNIISCNQVLYTGKLEDIRRQMGLTVEEMRNTDRSDLPEHLQKQDFSRTESLLRILDQILRNCSISPTQMYRERMHEARNPAARMNTQNDEKIMQSNGNGNSKIMKFIEEFINRDCLDKTEEYRSGYAAKVNPDNSISISFPGPEKEFEFFNELAKNEDFTVYNTSGELLMYAKNGQLYTADTQYNATNNSDIFSAP